jgi:hypothetical protein
MYYNMLINKIGFGYKWTWDTPTLFSDTKSSERTACRKKRYGYKRTWTTTQHYTLRHLGDKIN